MKCYYKTCPKEATEQVTFLLKAHPSLLSVQSRPVSFTCAEHAFLDWKDVYNVNVWDSVSAPFRQQGMMLPVQELSCIQIEPIKVNKS